MTLLLMVSKDWQGKGRNVTHDFSRKSAAAGASGQSALGLELSAFMKSAAERDGKVRARRNPGDGDYSLGEEIANAISHGVGAALSVAALVLLIVAAVGAGGGVYLLAAIVYGVALLFEFTMSTLYHAIPARRAKRVFKVLDHSGIYVLIAATYTPFCLITLAESGGYLLAAFVWVVALAGIVVEAFWTYRPRWISAVIYVLLGWSVVAFVPQLVAALPTTGLVLLIVGGVCYTVGAVFYVLKKIPYMHFVFHLFVLAGAIFHFFAVLLFVL